MYTSWELSLQSMERTDSSDHKVCSITPRASVYPTYSQAATNLFLVTIYRFAFSRNIYKENGTICYLFVWIIVFSLIILRFIPVVLYISSSLFLNKSLSIALLYYILLIHFLVNQYLDCLPCLASLLVPGNLAKLSSQL